LRDSFRDEPHSCRAAADPLIPGIWFADINIHKDLLQGAICSACDGDIGLYARGVTTGMTLAALSQIDEEKST
jgi:hypothetical protein